MSGGSSISQLDGSTIVLVMMMMMILAPDSFLLLPPLPSAAPPPPSSSSPAHGVSSSTLHTDMIGACLLLVLNTMGTFSPIFKGWKRMDIGHLTISYQKHHCTGGQPWLYIWPLTLQSGWLLVGACYDARLCYDVMWCPGRQLGIVTSLSGQQMGNTNWKFL